MFTKYVNEAYKAEAEALSKGGSLMNFTIVDREVSINTMKDPQLKIENFARICYRSEDKIKEGSAENLIKFCIAHDHGSVLEHFHIAAFFPSEGSFKEVMGDEALSPRRVWDACDCVTKRKFMFNYWSKYINVNPSIPKQQNMYWSCTSGSVRAWRSIIVPGIEASIQQNIYPALVLHVSLLKKLYELAPVLFEDIVNWFNIVLSCAPAHSNGTSAIDKLMTGVAKEDYKFENIPESTINTGIVIDEAIGAYASFECIADRADTQQLVRHRVDCSYSQESQRYCDYGKKGVRMVAPLVEPSIINAMDEEDRTQAASTWVDAMNEAAASYNKLRYVGIVPESARAVLPNSCASKIGISMSFQALEHFFNRRLEKDAQYSIRVMATRMLKELIDTNHPVMTNITPTSIVRWCKWLIEQKTPIGDLEFWTDLMDRTTKAIERNQEERKKMAERQAEIERKAEELREEQLKQEATDKDKPSEE